VDDLEDHQAGDSSSNEQHELFGQLKGHYKQRENSTPIQAGKHQRKEVHQHQRKE